MRTTCTDSVINTTNLASYSNADLVDTYRKQAHLHVAEKVILEKIKADIQDQAILDIGIGAGRTTASLRKLSHFYIGIDYSDTMIQTARADYPGLDLRRMDARDLSAFSDSSFNFVLFSFNGMDYVTHEGRLQVLREVLRVLHPGGWFAFSSHNRLAHGKPHSTENHPQEPLQRKKRSLLSLLNGAKHRLRNHITSRYYRARNKKHEFRSESYAILCDHSQLYSLLTYHIDITEQRKQLTAVGFDMEQTWAFDATGNIVTQDDQSLWVHYLTRKS